MNVMGTRRRRAFLEKPTAFYLLGEYRYLIPPQRVQARGAPYRGAIAMFTIRFGIVNIAIEFTVKLDAGQNHA